MEPQHHNQIERSDVSRRAPPDVSVHNVACAKTAATPGHESNNRVNADQTGATTSVIQYSVG